MCHSQALHVVCFAEEERQTGVGERQSTSDRGGGRERESERERAHEEVERGRESRLWRARDRERKIRVHGGRCTHKWGWNRCTRALMAVMSMSIKPRPGVEHRRTRLTPSTNRSHSKPTQHAPSSSLARRGTVPAVICVCTSRETRCKQRRDTVLHLGGATALCVCVLYQCCDALGEGGDGINDSLHIGRWLCGFSHRVPLD